MNLLTMPSRVDPRAVNGPETLVTNCSQLVTLAGPARPRVGAELRNLAIIPDGAMLIRGDRILAVGPRREIESQGASATRTVDAAGSVVMPGFVDAHTHLVFAGNRADEFEKRCTGTSYQQIAAAGGGIRATVRRTREASEDELVASATRYVNWFLRGGTTTIESKSGYGLTTQDEIKILRVLRRISLTLPLRCVSTFLGAHEIPEEYHGRAAEYIRVVVNEMLPRVATEGLAEFCDVFCEESVFDVSLAERVLRSARGLGLGVRMHADQFTSIGAAQLAASLRAKTADHLEHADAAAIAALKAGDVQPVLLPGSVYAIGSSRYAPARAMIDAGLAVVLATDFNPGSSPTASMTMVLSLACTQMKMTPAEAITAATINAAHSLNRGSEIGSLEPGKIADFVVHDAADYRELAYFFGGQLPRMVFTSGQRVI
jgi:imidazolonepropionase